MSLASIVTREEYCHCVVILRAVKYRSVRYCAASRFPPHLSPKITEKQKEELLTLEKKVKSAESVVGASMIRVC